MQKHEEWLFERLPEWEKEGLVDSASAERLRARYEKDAHPVASRGNLAMLIVSGLGALLVGLGVIALFAANWAAMSRSMRAGVSVLPLTCCSILALLGFARGWKTNVFWEALGICWTLAIWSGFGLVCQTYHLSDNVSGFVLACTLLCLPVLYLTRSAAAAVAWPLFGLVWFMMDQESSTPLRNLGYLAMLAAHLPAFVAIHRRLGLRKAYEFFGVGTISIGVWAIIANNWGYNSDRALLLAPMWLGVALWTLSEHTQWRHLRHLSLLYILPVVLLVPTPATVFSFRHHGLDVPMIALFLFLTTLVLGAGIFLLLRKGEKRLPQEKRQQLVVALLGLLATVVVFSMDASPFPLYLVILVVASLALVQALRNLRLLQMNLSLGILIYEILAKNLASDWSFTAKRLLLLFCGIVLLCSNIFIIRGHRQASKEVAS